MRDGTIKTEFERFEDKLQQEELQKLCKLNKKINLKTAHNE